MDRQEWVSQFIDELTRLRPYLATDPGAPSALRGIANLRHAAGAGTDPKVAARRYHELAPPPRLKGSP
jgi:hypothetical protein